MCSTVTIAKEIFARICVEMMKRGLCQNISKMLANLLVHDARGLLSFGAHLGFKCGITNDSKTSCLIKTKFALHY